MVWSGFSRRYTPTASFFPRASSSSSVYPSVFLGLFKSNVLLVAIPRISPLLGSWQWLPLHGFPHWSAIHQCISEGYSVHLRQWWIQRSVHLLQTLPHLPDWHLHPDSHTLFRLHRSGCHYNTAQCRRYHCCRPRLQNRITFAGSGTIWIDPSVFILKPYAGNAKS